jgi:hypothetical protein
MLDLNSPRSNKLSQAYGSAEGIPALLRQLKTARPSESYRSEPCGSVCHQGHVYTASYAALPHIIHLGLKRPVSERCDFILMSAKIEAMRHQKASPRVPRDLKSSYEDAIRSAYALVKSSLDHSWSEEEYRVLPGALLVFRGNPALANRLLDFDGDCQCPNRETVFPPLGYDILKSE